MAPVTEGTRAKGRSPLGSPLKGKKRGGEDTLLKGYLSPLLSPFIGGKNLRGTWTDRKAKRKQNSSVGLLTPVTKTPLDPTRSHLRQVEGIHKGEKKEKTSLGVKEGDIQDNSRRIDCPK